MAHSFSLRDQLLKAGLVTQEQVDQTIQSKPAKKSKPPSQKVTDKTASKPAKQPAKQNKPPREPSDLEKFYRERDQLERSERQEQEKLARERSARKKELREKTRILLEGKLQNREDAEIRYNFVIGDSVKYLYVTAEQQQQLAEGTLAITFLEGKRCLITAEVARQLQEIDSNKLVIINNPES